MINMSVTLMVGKLKKLEMAEPNADELAIFDRDFNTIVNHLRKIDSEIGDNFEVNRDFYRQALKIAKGYIERPFGGLRPDSGQFGFTLIAPPDWNLNTFTFSVSAGWQNLIGSSASPITAPTAATKMALFAWHGYVISGGPKPIYLRHTINNYTYPIYSVYINSLLTKHGKPYKIIHLPGNIVIHPGGSFYLRAKFDTDGTIEFFPLGLVFAMYDYLAEEK